MNYMYHNHWTKYCLDSTETPYSWLNGLVDECWIVLKLVVTAANFKVQELLFPRKITIPL